MAEAARAVSIYGRYRSHNSLGPAPATQADRLRCRHGLHYPLLRAGLGRDRRWLAAIDLAGEPPRNLLARGGARFFGAKREDVRDMAAAVDERTLCARFKSWIDAELQARPYGSLTRAENEVHASGSAKRHDLLIYAGNKPVFSCEVKVPTNARGASPYDPEVVDDARRKAEAEGLAYFGTFNCASFVLWQVDMPGVPVHSRGIDRWRVVEPQHLGRLESREAEAAFKGWLQRLLTVVAAVEAGAAPTSSIGHQPEEELIGRIEGSLETIVGLTFPDVVERFATDRDFRRDVKGWMINDQGWQWDDAVRDELLLKTTQVACYLQMNRILFYSTMRARFGALSTLELTNARSGRGVRQRLEPQFQSAMEASQDYETIFEVGYITEVAYASDAATRAWDALIRGIGNVDLSGVGLDVLGGIFERLLSPEERHRFGQHYTNPQLVDLLVASSVTKRDQVVLDPASGGGTFLVRAYERLRQLGEADHLVLLSQLYGNDVSRFAGHLSTVNLAVRQIAREQNYPRVGTHDFFSLNPGSPLVSLPLGPGNPPERQPVQVPETVDAIIGNPPYVRRQVVDNSLKRRADDAVHKYAVEHNRSSYRLDGLSDLHVYFWPQATRFLAEGGYLAFLTSSSWLQTRYGRQLRQLLLRDYEIVFIAETSAEPWFSDARVRTVATVARKRARNSEISAHHDVRFCQFRRPLLELLGPPSAPERWQRVEALLEKMKDARSDETMRVRLVKQRSLSADEDWSPPLRAPDIYERFIELPGVKRICSPKADDADPYTLTVGPKFGSRWFVVTDIGANVSDTDLADWGLRRRQVTGPHARYRIVSGGDWRGPIESRYLQRWVRGPGDEPSRTLSREAGDLVVTIPRRPTLPASAKVRDYIRYGEAQGEHRRVYTGQRRRFWYCVEEMPRGPIIFPYSMQYGHKVWANPAERKFTTSPSAYLTPNGAEPEVALALLNSTWTYLAALFEAGAVGTEALVRFGGRGSWQRLNTIDPARATPNQAAQLTDIWGRIARSEALPFPPEGREPLAGARRELDELALMVAGVDDRVDASEMVDELYGWLQRHTAERSEVEEMAVSGRQSRTSGARLQNIIDQVFQHVTIAPAWLDDVDALWTVWTLPDEAADTSGQISLLGFNGRIEQPTDVQFGQEWVRFESEEQADFVRTLAASRMAPRRLALPPREVAAAVNQAAIGFIEEKHRELRQQLSERMNDDDNSYADAYVQLLSRLAAATRTALHAS